MIHTCLTTLDKSRLEMCICRSEATAQVAPEAILCECVCVTIRRSDCITQPQLDIIVIFIGALSLCSTGLQADRPFLSFSFPGLPFISSPLQSSDPEILRCPIEGGVPPHFAPAGLLVFVTGGAALHRMSIISPSPSNYWLNHMMQLLPQKYDKI